MAFINTVVARAAAGIWGLKLGYATTQAVLGQFNANGGNLDVIINNAFNASYTGVSNAAVAAMVVGNLGLTGAAATEATTFLVAQMDSVAPTARGAILTNAINLFAGLGTNPAFGASANDFNAKVAAAAAYSGTIGNPDAVLGNLPSATSFFMLTGQDNITATAGNDTINAYIFDNANTLQSGDFVDGGAGTDTLYADMGNSATQAVTPITRNIETFVVRAQSRATESGDNNVSNENRVTIDAERMVGVNRFESNNSRADLIVEDVRILPAQITKDITIAFTQSDPGNVDFGVYFDQASLRANSTSSSSLTLQVIDLKAAGAAATAATPLLDSPYDGISFTLNGTLVFLTSPAIGNATTYPALLSAIQAQLAANVLTAGVVTAALGSTFTVNDSQTLAAVTGTSIVLSATNATFGIGNWIASQGVPANSNLFTNQFAGSSATNDLVTSTIILDDVGRGSTGGDLVIGGLSVGETSTSRGVDRFEITVERTSRLQNVDSTNNWLKEVVLKNGTASGNVSILGNAGGAVTGAPNNAASQAGALPGAVAQHDDFGFNDVRLIDASAMRGTVTFDAAVTAASFAKYILTRDTQPNPAGDNTSTPGQTTQVADFIYTGGVGNDSMTVAIDSGIASSRNTIMSGREDFTFNLAGGAGNDTISVRIDPLNGGFQNWYNNQKLNANVRIDGGDGNDTIRTPGAGDAIIFGGSGTDTIYVDNTGTQAINQGSENDAGRVYAAAAAAELAAANAARALSNSTSAAVLQAREVALNTLNLVTPVSFTDPAVPANPNPALPTKGDLETAILAAYNAGITVAAPGALTADQVVALFTAYGTRVGSAVTPATTVIGNATFTAGTAPASATLTLAEFTAGNNLLESYINANRSAAATAAAADAAVGTYAPLLNATQTDVVNNTVLVSGAYDGAASAAGTATILSGLQALNAALVLGAAQPAWIAALKTAVANGSRTVAEAQALETAIGAGAIDAADVTAIQLILAPAINAATNANTTAQANLTAAINADNAAVRTAANFAGIDPVLADAEAVAQDAVGSAEAIAAATAAANAVTTFTGTPTTGTLGPLLAQQSGLTALSAALAVGVSDLDFQIITTNAVFNNVINGAAKIALDAVATGAAGVLTLVEKVNQVDVQIAALQRTSNVAVADAQAQLATLQSIAAATAFARDQAVSAAEGFVAGTTAGTSNAVWVLNTSNQLAVSTAPGSGYALAVNDERNIFDLRSDLNNSYNLFATRLTVDFKGLTSVVTVPSTNYRTSDLQVNQAIKDAINNNAVLNKLIVAADGPANSLTITSLIDGQATEANLSITIAVPVVGAVAPSDISAAAAVYGVAANEGAVLAAMATAKQAFDTKGDYTDRFAETGALGGNTEVRGAASVSTSDNTVTPGADNDVIVLGTTSGSTALLSSNDMVVFGAAFGNDTIVHFRAGSLATGGDVLNFAALGGTTLSTAFDVNRSVNVAEEVAATNGTAALVAALFTDSATAKTHVYIAFDAATNVGKVYAVTDAAGVGAGSVSATLAGTIDLADTLWSSLTTDNFGSVLMGG